GLSAAAEGGVRRAALERECAIAIRRTLAERVIESFQPDLVVIDRDPTHLPSEIQPVLSFVREELAPTRGGGALPDRGGSPRRRPPRWSADGIYQSLDDLCDEIWVY